MNRRGFFMRLFGLGAVALPDIPEPEPKVDPKILLNLAQTVGAPPLMSCRDYLINVCHYKPDVADNILRSDEW